MHHPKIASCVLAAFILPVLLPATPADAQEDPDLFIVARNELPDFLPSFTAAVATFGGLVIMPGSTEDADGNLDAVLVARDTDTREEAWRVEFGVAGFRDRFFHVAQTSDRVCTSGIAERPFPELDILIVGCFRGRDGRELWFHQIRSPVIPFLNHELEIAGRNVFVRIGSSSTPFVFRFDLANGSP